MDSRSLYLLSLIERSLFEAGCADVRPTPQRAVHRQNGLARLAFDGDVGSIVLQVSTLADGQTRVQAAFVWPEASATETFCLELPFFDWAVAAARAAQTWMAGPAANRKSATPFPRVEAGPDAWQAVA